MATPRDRPPASGSATSAAFRDSIRDMDLRNNRVGPTMDSLKRTSRHLGSQSPDPPDDIEEQLGASTPRTVLQRSSYPSRRSCSDANESRDSGYPHSSRILSEDDDEEDRNGCFFDYYQPSDDASPPPPSSKQHIRGQNTQAYDDAIDCDAASGSAEDSPRAPEEIEMQIFHSMEIEEKNRMQKQNNDMIYDEKYDVGGDSDCELTSVVVDPAPPRHRQDEDTELEDVNVRQRLYGGEVGRHYGSTMSVGRDFGSISPATRAPPAPTFPNSSRFYLKPRSYTNSKTTSVDSGVQFPLSTTGTPPFGDPVDMKRVFSSTERLLDGKRTASTNTDGRMDHATSHTSNMDNNSQTKKKGKKPRKDDSSLVDVNGNPIPRGPGGLCRTVVPTHAEQSNFSNLNTEREPLIKDNNGSRLKKQKRKKVVPFIKAENMDGHISIDSVEDALEFVTGKVSQKKKEVIAKGKGKETAPVASKGKKKKGKKSEGVDSPPPGEETSSHNTTSSSDKPTVTATVTVTPKVTPTPKVTQPDYESPLFLPATETVVSPQETSSSTVLSVTENDADSVNIINYQIESFPSIPLTPPPSMEEEFTLVKNHKKVKKESSAVNNVGTASQRRFPRNGPRSNVVNIATITGRTSPRSLSPGAFPVLGREGRRNSTGTVPTSMSSPMEESDTESVKSLPMVSGPVPAQTSGLPSYANVVAKPRDQVANGTAASTDQVVIAPVAPTCTISPKTMSTASTVSTSSITSTTGDTTATVYDNVGYPPLVANISRDNETTEIETETHSMQHGAPTLSYDSRISSATTTTTTTIRPNSSTNTHNSNHGNTHTSKEISNHDNISFTISSQQVAAPLSSSNNKSSSSISSPHTAAINTTPNSTTNNHKLQQSAKKTSTSQSVIFLDRKFHQPVAPLDISFGFEPELPTLAPLELDDRTAQDNTPPAKVNPTEAFGCDVSFESRNAHDDELVNSSPVPPPHPAPPRPLPSASGDAEGIHTDKSASISQSQDSKYKKSGLPNGLVVRPGSKPTIPQHTNIVKRLAKPKRPEDDANFKPGKFNREGAVSYILAEWIAVIKQKDKDPRNVVMYKSDV